MTFTLRPKTLGKPSRGMTILLDGKVVGHIGQMASGAHFVNAFRVHPKLAFAGHATTMDGALVELVQTHEALVQLGEL